MITLPSAFDQCHVSVPKIGGAAVPRSKHRCAAALMIQALCR
jgi:hypothetical protein